MHLVARLGSGIPLVGRVDERSRLRAALAAAEGGTAGAVLLSGDAGVGKTRLLTDLAEHAAERGALVLTGRCLDMRDGGVPYLPFAEALAPLTAMEDGRVGAALRSRPALGRLLPQLQVVPPATGEYAQVPTADAESPHRARSAQDVGELQLFDAVLGLLTELAGHRPVALVLEDLHWADGATRNLVSFLLSRLRAQRLLVIVSYREEDVYRRHPLRALLSELVRLPTVDRVDLRPFGPAEARSFVEALAEEPLPAEVVADVVERSEGNPFFAEELLASGTCTDLPAGLAEVLLARLEQLAPATRRVLRAVAVASDAVAHAALAEVSGLGELELDEALREAVQHHVLVIENGFYTFRHALLQEAVYGDVLPGERGRMHAAYAARIRSKPQGRGHDAKLAYHSMRSRDFPTALAALVPAAHEAEGLGAPGAALRHIEQALEIWDAVPAGERPEGVDELKLLHKASFFAGTSGEPERAIAFARSAVDALGPDTDRERAAQTWRRLAEALMATDSTFDESVEPISRAWELVADSEASTTRAWVLATRAQIMRGIERFDDAEWSARTAVADARAVGAGGAEAAALTMLGALADSAGDPQRARTLLREAVAKARAAGAITIELRAMYFLALSHDDLAEIDVAIDLYQRGIDRAEETGLSWSSFGLGVRARHLFLRYVSGDWPDGTDPGQPRSPVSSTVTAMLAASWVYLVVARGRFAEAERLVADLRAQRRTDVLIALAAAAAGTELASWQGEHAEAVHRAREGIGWLESFFPWALAGLRAGALGLEACAAWAAEARRRGDAGAEAEAAAEAERLLAHVRGCARHGRPRAGTLGREGQAWLARAEAAAAGVAGQGDPALWAKAVEAFGYGAVYDQAVCRLRHAEALLAAGDAGAAGDELREAHRVARGLGARPLLEAVRELAHRARTDLPGERPRRDVLDPLTERERAVLERVALGRTNRQVGEELFISEKTVSVHLSRVMAKLGAGRRAEAVAIAYDRGLLER
ncbi:regulatory LuxR family protein [Prauserella shujinwangii]|uniref:Regulatory LuxR family protein n=1 Tax=Prauserella shujinwangii TaxID=1453103 RepID=A0A2T0M347_9PSEU|nr:LuxR family transcriptional regulator [Prauserella shujinwangii]PRX51168.1 regulatory LuxR family protein [Prauserella shujinwangii]